MTPFDGLRAFSAAWTEQAAKLLKLKPWDFKNGSPKGPAKAITQLETGVFFLTIAKMAKSNKVYQKVIAMEWIKGELTVHGKTFEDLRDDNDTHLKTLKRVKIMIHREMENLKDFDLFLMHSDNSYTLTVLGKEVLEALGG